MRAKTGFLLAALLGVVALAGGCCWDGPFCEIPKCDPCAPKCNPCEPVCAPPCPPPCPPGGVVVQPAPVMVTPPPPR